MKHILFVIISVILSDFYFFPIEFIFLPGINTKMVMAVFGLLLVGYRLSVVRNAQIDRGLWWLSCSALCVSLASFLSIVVNNTADHSFTGYIVSMWVWMGGAYTMIMAIKKTHNGITVPLVCNYLIVVCVIQCVLAYTMNIYTPLRSWVDSIVGGEAFMGKAEGRIYGIGAALDVAGLRFSAVLVLLAYTMVVLKKHYGWYLSAFFIISIIGNMISRTTTMGMIIAIIYLIYRRGAIRDYINSDKLESYFIFFGILLMMGVVVYAYNVNTLFHDSLRFGFEGFFSFFETGKWQTNSNNILLNHMIVFPETVKTWIIGDGYCANPLDKSSFDPYYVGPAYHGFYMGTDIGYLRFLFYFGIIGLITFISYFIICYRVCVIKFPNYRVLFLLLLLVNFIGWCKVSTDIFLIFAPFICLDKEDDKFVSSFTLKTI